jgi:uncharacterized membrane protein
MKYVNAVTERNRYQPRPAVRAIGWADLREALVKGVDDFKAMPSYAIFLCLIYALVTFFSARLTFQLGIFYLFFPLASGIALVGPVAALGFYEISRRRELGLDVSWTHAVAVLRSPSIFNVATIGVALMAIFIAWLYTARAIYEVIFGDMLPAPIGQFFHQLFATTSGWTLIVLGNGIGALFAGAALSISVVSIPLVLDRGFDAVTAVRVSILVVLTNPKPMAQWGAIVAVGLVIGSLPVFVGLAVVMPVLGHSTWHLYRKVLGRQGRLRGERDGRHLVSDRPGVPSRKHWFWKRRAAGVQPLREISRLRPANDP